MSLIDIVEVIIMNSKYTIDEVEEILNEIYDEFPPYVFNNLNLGVHLNEEVKLHKDSVKEKPMYVLGEYIKGKMGRQIIIYYGSFINVYSYLNRDMFKNELRKTFAHELTHHMEDQGGEWQLELDDFNSLEKYRYNTNNIKKE